MSHSQPVLLLSDTCRGEKPIVTCKRGKFIEKHHSLFHLLNIYTQDTLLSCSVSSDPIHLFTHSHGAFHPFRSAHSLCWSWRPDRARGLILFSRLKASVFRKMRCIRVRVRNVWVRARKKCEAVPLTVITAGSSSSSDRS